MTNKDMQRLVSLANQQLEIANSEKMSGIISDWKKHGNFESNTRPMITMELWTFQNDIIPPLLQCEDEKARALETKFLSNIVNHTLFDDDTVVNPYMPFSYEAQFVPFNLPVKIDHASATDGNDLGHHFVEQLVDLESDFGKLSKSKSILVPKEKTHKEMDEYNELFGKILPARLVGGAVYAVPMQDIVHLMSMENMYFSMYDYPELFHKMMDMLTDDYLEHMKAIADDKRLFSTNGSERVSQGSYGFNNILPDKEHCEISDIWGYMDAQEAAGLSPEMYKEFIFPYYKKIMDSFGRCSYGCCEAVDPIWDSCISKVENLGKVSISPWCNEEYMGERLKGKKITYLRKPSPNLIGVQAELDETAVREHFEKTVKASKGCHLEIVQRDVYYIHNTYQKVKRYVEIIREECAKHE